MTNKMVDIAVKEMPLAPDGGPSPPVTLVLPLVTLAVVTPPVTLVEPSDKVVPRVMFVGTGAQGMV